MLPRLYPILDRAFIAPAEASEADRLNAIVLLVKAWSAAGVRFLQYRNKTGNEREMLADAREIVRVLHSLGHRSETILIMNDRADLCLAAEFDGVHLGQDDLSPAAVRHVLASVPQPRIIGVSCHNAAQIEAADADSEVDYLAIGPVFATSSKLNPDPVIGLTGLTAIRKLTSKPLVAIGGITRANCGSVIHAGADSVAVISDLYCGDPAKSVADFHSILG